MTLLQSLLSTAGDANHTEATVEAGGRATAEVQALGAQSLVGRVERAVAYSIVVRWKAWGGAVLFTDRIDRPGWEEDGTRRYLIEDVPAWTPRVEVEVIDQAGEAAEATLSLHLR